MPRVGGLGAHQHQRALRKWRVHQQHRARKRQPEVDVVQQEEWRERPQQVEDEQEWPDAEKFLAHPGRAEEPRREQECAHGNQDGRRHHQNVEHQRGLGQRPEQVLNFRQVGQCPHVEADVHQLHQHVQCLNHLTPRLRQVLGRGENPGEDPGFGPGFGIDFGSLPAL